MRNGIFSVVSVNEDVIVISNCSPPLWAGEPSGNSGMRRVSALWQPSDYSHSLRWTLRKGNSGCENRTLARQVRCIWNEWFQWALTRASCHTQKSTKSLNSGYLVFLTIIFWYSDYLPFLTKLYVIWLLPSPPQSRSYLRWCHLGLKSWKFLPNKT